MRRIMNGKLIDTDRAECLAIAQYSAPGDFSWWNEELLLMPDGEFALYGAGGPSRQIQDSTQSLSPAFPSS